MPLISHPIINDLRNIVHDPLNFVSAVIPREFGEANRDVFDDVGCSEKVFGVKLDFQAL